jgi:hypothetical protein
LSRSAGQLFAQRKAQHPDQRLYIFAGEKGNIVHCTDRVAEKDPYKQRPYERMIRAFLLIDLRKTRSVRYDSTSDQWKNQTCEHHKSGAFLLPAVVLAQRKTSLGRDQADQSANMK